MPVINTAASGAAGASDLGHDFDTVSDQGRARAVHLVTLAGQQGDSRARAEHPLDAASGPVQNSTARDDDPPLDTDGDRHRLR